MSLETGSPYTGTRPPIPQTTMSPVKRPLLRNASAVEDSSERELESFATLHSPFTSTTEISHQHELQQERFGQTAPSLQSIASQHYRRLDDQPSRVPRNFYGDDIRGLVDESPNTPRPLCTVRRDSSGPWNFFKAWNIFVLHACACVLLVAGVISINDRLFQIGSGPSLFAFASPLHQAQVTGLISLALVIIRLVAVSCSALLAWRIVYILLEKKGIALSELTQITSWRIPFLPKMEPTKYLFWSLWTMTAVLLLWPQSFAAPFASSSVSWIPASRIIDDWSSASVPYVGEYADWIFKLYEGARMRAIIGGAAMTAKDPKFAFGSANLPLRRHFNSSEIVPSGSKIDIKAPYFAVENLRWVDASNRSECKNAGDTLYQDVNQNFNVTAFGAVSIVRDKIWDPFVYHDPPPLSTVSTTVVVAVMLDTLYMNKSLADGTLIDENTECPRVVSSFGSLPDVGQTQMTLWAEDSTDVFAYNCYICAEATIRAGTFAGKDCMVSASGDSLEYATCYVQDKDDTGAEKDRLTGLAVDFVSEVMKYTAMLNYSGPWMSSDLTNYTSGMLKLGYSGAWNGLTGFLGNDTETATFRRSEQMVSASIDRSKLYIWIGMNSTMTLSSVIVLFAQLKSRTKTVRNTDLAALTIDLTGVSHSRRADGLCNAATLSKADGKLSRMRWAEIEMDGERPGSNSHNSCLRKVVFVDDEVRSARTWTKPFKWTMKNLNS